ncbi:MAG TPA: GHKL domain-containing protein [Clostridiaceae bacterium]|nr:GHKL domain-containing protein [Clostridiaceae bacterium]
MKKHFSFSFFAVIILLVVMTVNGIIFFNYRLGTSDGVQAITHFEYTTDTGDSGTLELPTKVKLPEPRTAITLTAEIENGPGKTLLVKSVFCPLKVYANEELLQSYGQPGSYPSFFNDPPTALMLIPLPPEGEKVSLRVSYQSPKQRNPFTLPVIYAGTSDNLLNMQYMKDGFSFSFSLMIMYFGLFVIVVSFIFIRKIPASIAFLRLGISSFLMGMWSFGECDLTVLLFPYPVLLHGMTYFGLFLVTFSLLHFGLIVVQPNNRLPILCMMWINGISVAVALMLQFSGLVDFTRSLYWFLFIIPLSIVTLSIFLFWEWRYNHNEAARRFAPSGVILVIGIILGLFHYWKFTTDRFTLFFEVSTIAFMLSLGIISGQYMEDYLNDSRKKEQLEYKMKAVNHQLYLQRMQYEKIAENDALIKAQRHDLRHQLTVLRDLYEQKDEEKFSNYLDTISEKLPSGREPALCENYAVNAVASHYAKIARQTGAEVSVDLSIPLQLPTEVESDLCIIIGNLMENAAEACARMTGNERFVHVKSLLQYGILTIAVDNSFEGDLHQEDGDFLSSKREGKGIGLASVSAVARKYNGDTEFREGNGIFQASVYVKLE